MKAVRKTWLNKLVHRLGSSPVGAWVFSRTLPFQDRLVLALTGGRWTVTGLLAGFPVVWVTSTGAKTGRPRTSPLVGVPDPESAGTVALIGTNFGQQHYPAWYLNLKANPRARCTINRVTGMYDAREAQGAEYDKFWRLAGEIYAGYPLYKQRIQGRHIPILVLSPSPR